jgi:hypothetical protein
MAVEVHWYETTIGDLLAEHGGSVKTGPFGTALKANEYSIDVSLLFQFERLVTEAYASMTRHHGYRLKSRGDCPNIFSRLVTSCLVERVRSIAPHT